MTRQRILPTLIGLLLLGVSIPMALSSPVPDVPVPDRSQLQRVAVSPVTADAGGSNLRFPGVLRSRERASLAFPLSGRLVARPADVGDRVRKGEELARLEELERENAVDTAAGALAEVEARRAQLAQELARVERLAAAGAATPEELEQARAAVAALAAGVTSAAARHRETQRLRTEVVLRAPFAGTVSRVLAEPGEHLGQGEVVFEVSGDGGLEVEVGVPEDLIVHLDEGQEVAVELPLSGGLGARGTLSSVGRVAAGPARLFPVLVALTGDQPGLAAGMTAEVTLATRATDQLTVPLGAVLNPGGGQPAVFRLQGGQVEKVSVEVERLVGALVVVRGLLVAGDQVVVRGISGLRDGETVEVVP